MPLVTESIPKTIDAFAHKRTRETFSGYDIDEYIEQPLDASVYITKEIDARDWKAIIRNGGNATTQLSVSRSLIEYSPMSASSTECHYNIGSVSDPDTGEILGFYRNDQVTNNLCDLYGGYNVLGASPAPFADIVEADSRALDSFYGNLRNAQTLEQGGTFVAEIHQTIHGIRHPADALVKFLKSHISLLSKRKTAIKRAIGRGDINTAKRIAGIKHYHNPDSAIASMVSNSWLEAQYHWLPTISDIQDSAKAVASLQNRPPTKRVRGGYKDSTSGDLSEAIISCGSLAIHCSTMNKLEADVRYYGAVKLIVPDGLANNFGAAVQALGLGFSNFIPTLYNIIPYSFVVDYFSNLGSVIDALSFPLSDVAWASKTSLTRDITLSGLNFHTTKPDDELTASYTGSASPGKYVKTFENIARTSLQVGDLGVPSLELKIPGIDKKWLNLSALATQLAFFRRS